MNKKHLPCPVDGCNGALIPEKQYGASGQSIDHGKKAEWLQRQYVKCNGHLADNTPCSAFGVWDSHINLTKPSYPALH